MSRTDGYGQHGVMLREITAAGELAQANLLGEISPEAIVAAALTEFGPAMRTFSLCSGGNDSVVAAHRCRELYDELAFIDTGTAIPGVREHVQRVAVALGKPLRILEAGDAYRLLVLGGIPLKSRAGFRPALGFPRPVQHGQAYEVLKKAQLIRLRDEAAPGGRVLFLTGVRRSESQRRRQRPAVNYRDRMIFANPLIGWSAIDMAEYRARHDLPESEVAALIHRSGECNCGSFAGPGEREMLSSLWPEWWQRTIGALEDEAKAAGIAENRWGAGRLSRKPLPAASELCTDCQMRLAV